MMRATASLMHCLPDAGEQPERMPSRLRRLFRIMEWLACTSQAAGNRNIKGAEKGGS